MAHSVKYTQNLVYDKEFNLGCEFNLNQDMALKSAYAYFAMVGSNGNYYLRSQLFNWFVGAGSWWKTDCGKYSVEVQYDLKDKKAGLMGQPVFLRYGSKHKLGALDYHMNLLLGNTITFKDKCDMKVNDQLKVSVTATGDLGEIVTKGESSSMTLGVTAELKI